MTPWTPVPPGRSRKTIAVPASPQSSTVLAGGRDGSRAPFRRAPGKKKRRSRVPALVNRACRGAVTAPAPRSAGHTAKKNAVPASRRSSTVSAGPQSTLPWAFNSRTYVFSHYSTAFRGQNPIAMGVCPNHRIFSENVQKAPVALQGLFVACFTFEILFFFCFRLCECANAMPLRPSGPELHPHLHGRTRIM